MTVGKVIGLYFLSVGAAVLATDISGPGISQTYRQQDDGGSYQFGYDVQDAYSQQFRQETRDGLGRVVGSYGLTEADGRKRIVDYVADEYGFRANVRTNEPGTNSQEPAFVSVGQIDERLPPLPPPATPVNISPVLPNVPPSRGYPVAAPVGPSVYPSRPLLPLAPQTLDDVQDDSLGTAYTQNYPKVPVEPAKTSFVRNLTGVPVSLTGTPLYITPYILGLNNPRSPQSSQPGYSGIGLITKNPDYNPNSAPQSAVQGVTYYPNPNVRLYSYPYSPDSGNTFPVLYQRGKAATPNFGNLAPGASVAPKIEGSFNKPNIILRAVPVANGIQAVAIDASTGKVYTGNTGFPALDAMNKGHPVGTNPSENPSGKAFPSIYRRLDSAGNINPSGAGVGTVNNANPSVSGLGPSGIVHPSITGLPGVGTVRSGHPRGPVFRGLGTGSDTELPGYLPVHSVYPNVAGSIELDTAGKRYSGAPEFTRLDTAEKIYQGIHRRRGSDPTGVVNVDVKDRAYPTSTDLTGDPPKFGTRLRPPQSRGYNGQLPTNLANQGNPLYRVYRHSPDHPDVEDSTIDSENKKEAEPLYEKDQQ